MATGMKIPTVYLPRPMAHQLPLLLSPARFKLTAMGRRWGKTAALMIAALRGHGPESGVFKGVIDGGRIWWVAPTYPEIEASNIWRDLKRACRDAWETKSEITRTITLANGGSISVRCASDTDTLRGPGLDGLIIDEAAFVKPEAWLEVLRPSLADKQGWAILGSTPNGKNWFYQKYLEWQQQADAEVWRQPTSDNPLVTPEELESIQKEIGPRRYAQELEANFLTVEGALWPGEYFEDIYTERWPDSFDRGVIAIDPSLGKTEAADYSAIIFAGLSGGKIYIDVDMQKTTPTVIVDRTLRMYDRYRPSHVGIESNGFQEVLKPLFDLTCQVRHGAPLPICLIHNGPAKEVRIQRLDPYLANDTFRVRKTEYGINLVDQMMMFPTKGWHDDGPDALEMAMRLLDWGSASHEPEPEVLRA